MKWLWACECRGVGADKSAMGAINRPLWPVHVMRISGGREDKSRTLLYQVYQVYRAACEPAVFSSNRMSGVSEKFEGKWFTVARVSRVSGVSEKFEWKWLTVSEFQVFQEYQVYQVYQRSLSGSSSLFQSFRCFKSFRWARYLGQIASTTLAFILELWSLC